MNLKETKSRIEELKVVYREGPGMVDAGSVNDHLLELFSICCDLIAEVERLEKQLGSPYDLTLAETRLDSAQQYIAALERERTDLEQLREAMVKQNAQQEQEIEELEAKVCQMREALQEVAEDDDPRDGCAHADRAKQALSSAPPVCPHKEEAEKLREQLTVGEAGGRLLKAIQEKTEAEVAALQAALDEANGRVMEWEFRCQHFSKDTKRYCPACHSYPNLDNDYPDERHSWSRERWTEEAKAMREKG